ncbi:MAG: helix-turn-helix domain containing protein [Desulfobacula sp.]|jgi:putative transposase|nr:helix-turn-helix domain containing protein [Desulfobacula sp.]
MSKKNFTQKEKIAVLKSAEKTNVRDVAKVAGVHYTKVYDWRQLFKAMGEEPSLKCKAAKPGRGIKQISPEKDQAVLKDGRTTLVSVRARK